jgi:Fe-S-cluster-containing hydrogenase component 2
MAAGFAETGVASRDELLNSPGYPSEARLAKGAVAVIECMQEIPCDPCESACPSGAITVGEPITNVPVLDGEKCIGCGLCIAACPGQAIFLVNLRFAADEALVAFPYEFLPLPEVGSSVEAVNRRGEVVSVGRVVRVIDTAKQDRTPTVHIAVPQAFAHEVRSIKRGRQPDRAR